MKKEEALAKMAHAGFTCTKMKKIDYGWQLRFGKRIVNVYRTGRLLIQGEDRRDTAQILLGASRRRKRRRPGTSKKALASPNYHMPMPFDVEAHHRELQERLAGQEGEPPWED